MNEGQTWWSAVLVMASRYEGAYRNFKLRGVDMRTILLTAPDWAAAYAKAASFGKKAEWQYEAKYPNRRPHTVIVEFLGLAELLELIGEPEDGWEVGWKLLDTRYPERLVMVTPPTIGKDAK